ncbi:MAG: IPT/TIG domain-containing protein [Treponema sp.]|nr:IPT/TIG domain-containing protein [Treponema sp.]
MVNHSVHEKPVIFSVSPQVASAGDKITIKGKYFHHAKDSGFVEIAGSKLSGSTYNSWKDDEIVLTIPAGISDGLLFVVSSAGKSNPDFFASKPGIPTLVPQTSQNTRPAISSISAETLYVGQILTISGKNFGPKKPTSKVFFSTRKISSSGQTNALDDGTEYIPANDANFDYDYWSESEIRVTVPDGATTGTIYVQTENGQSQKHLLTVQQKAGIKYYERKQTYVIQLGVDINGIQGTKDSIINVRFPHPELTSSQIMTDCTEMSQKPLLEDFDGTTLYQIGMDATGRNSFAAAENTHISQTHAITVRSVRTRVDIDYVTIPTNRSRQLYRTFTSADKIVPADVPQLVNLLPMIIYQSRNPYRQAKLIYEYMVNNYKILNELREDSDGKSSTNCLDMLKSRQGDAYDFAVLYAALLRTAGVPAKVMTGLFIDKNREAHNHWWVEFYIDDFGWIPADPALGAGLNHSLFTEVNRKTFYFGNLDSQHIIFSQTVNNLKPALVNSKTKTYDKSWAMQSIWEETTSDVTDYKAEWNSPVVIGIY